MSEMMEARRAQRLQFQTHSPAFFAEIRVSIVDVSSAGIGILHSCRMTPGESGILEFTWDGARMRVPCKVVHCLPLANSGLFRSGLELPASAPLELSAFLRSVNRQLHAVDDDMLGDD